MPGMLMDPIELKGGSRVPAAVSRALAARRAQQAQQPQRQGMLPIPADLDDKTFAEIMRLRSANPAPEDQALLGPFEHRAYAREAAYDEPFASAIAMPFMIPGYTAAKALGATNARSPASIEEMIQAYKGLAEGLKARALGEQLPDPVRDMLNPQRMGVDGRKVQRPGMLQRPPIPPSVGVRG